MLDKIDLSDRIHELNETNLALDALNGLIGFTDNSCLMQIHELYFLLKLVIEKQQTIITSIQNEL